MEVVAVGEPHERPRHAEAYLVHEPGGVSPAPDVEARRDDAVRAMVHEDVLDASAQVDDHVELLEALLDAVVALEHARGTGVAGQQDVASAGGDDGSAAPPDQGDVLDDHLAAHAAGAPERSAGERPARHSQRLDDAPPAFLPGHGRLLSR